MGGAIGYRHDSSGGNSLVWVGGDGRGGRGRDPY